MVASELSIMPAPFSCLARVLILSHSCSAVVLERPNNSGDVTWVILSCDAFPLGLAVKSNNSLGMNVQTHESRVGNR